MKHAKFVSFTEIGAQTAAKAARLLPDFLCERYARTVDLSLSNTSLPRFAQQAMVDCDLIVFVGAAGIAVRAAAPYLAGKAYDPAVVVIDEQGRFVIPLLSGHLGGANELAERLAEGLGATAVITTATDGRAVFAVDSWAKSHECVVFDPENIKYISGALLRGDTVGLRSAFPVDGLLPAHINTKTAAESGFVIGFDTEVQPFPHTLHLVPRVLSLGIGWPGRSAAGGGERCREHRHQEGRAGPCVLLRRTRAAVCRVFGRRTERRARRIYGIGVRERHGGRRQRMRARCRRKCRERHDHRAKIREKRRNSRVCGRQIPRLPGRMTEEEQT